MRYILTAEDTDRAGELGGKAGALAALQRVGLPAPPWFVVSPAAFDASLTSAQRRTLAESDGDPAVLQRLLDTLTLAPEAHAEISAALGTLCPDKAPVAVRSSALDEDSPRFSFAGQLDSFLFVTQKDLAKKILAVWRSGFSARILAYRREHGLPPLPRPPAVIIQRMVTADAAGVAFSADPVSGRRGVAVVSAVYGLGTALVSGESDADTFQVSRIGVVIDRKIADKPLAHRPDPKSPEGVRAESVEEPLRSLPALTDGQAKSIAELARQAAALFGTPQDIEWALESGRLYLLQSRPITSLAGMPDPDGERNIWDNSNIAESYGGITTPLTFSFARCAYEHVYREFCRLMGVPEATIADNDLTFRRMLGLIRGRIYYNLLSWYRVLAMLPGFTVNRRFMEGMMGVKEGLPREVLAEIGSARWTGKLADGARLVATMGRLLVNFVTLPRAIRIFYRRLDTALAPPTPPLEAMRADELAAYYHGLERSLLTRWDAPLVNDFFTMIFFGLLRQLTARWLDDANGTLQNDLLSGQGNIISAEPARRLREMARLVRDDRAMVALLCDGPLDAIVRKMATLPLFAARYREYLEVFGDRCLEELKLESPTLYDDPLLLLRSIGQLARNPVATDAPTERPIERAEREVRLALAKKPLRRILFAWVLANARERVRGRENLRFERTRVFGRVRRVFLEMGKRFAADGLLEAPRDIFYLELDEVLGVVDGTATADDLQSLAAVRKAEFARYAELPAPPDRFETTGIVHQGFVSRETVAPAAGDDDQRQGLGCCPGIVRGRVRVITDPRHAQLETGSILVAERTDPGWIMLFPAAAGVLVERGSLLSHSAIVARELGIPAVVSIPGITRWLRDGDWVEFDGSTGVVRRIGEPDGSDQVIKLSSDPVDETVAQAPSREGKAPSEPPVSAVADKQPAASDPLSGSTGFPVRRGRKPSRSRRSDGSDGASPSPELAATAVAEVAEKADFSEIRYAQCWEDADVLLAGLEIQPGDTCLSIASAGDNSLAMLAKNPARVIALDLSPAQLACLALRVAAYRELEHEELLELIGSYPSTRREELYGRCRGLLSPDDRDFWDAHPANIAGGIGGAGKFERYFRLFRQRVLPLIHPRSRITELFGVRSLEERQAFYEKVWNNWRWRLLFRAFFSRFVMGRMGRDPSFFQYVEGHVAERILERARYALTELDAADNPYLQWILRGEHLTALPFALRAANFDAIRANLDRLEWHCRPLEGYLAEIGRGAIDRYNLSDIFEYMSPEHYQALLEQLIDSARPGARLAYWNMLAERRRPEALADRLRPLDALAERLHREDKAFFYRAFVLEEVIG
ncbi:MAG: DUF3419 family protein [Armatimonadota bacterium]